MSERIEDLELLTLKMVALRMDNARLQMRAVEHERRELMTALFAKYAINGVAPLGFNDDGTIIRPKLSEVPPDERATLEVASK